MNEQSIQQNIRLTLSKLGCRIWRNNQGAFKDKHGNFIRYGVCQPGGSDLIGWTPITITADMVGQKIAAFTAIEVKTPKGRATDDQINFLHRLAQDGGFGGIARSPEEAVGIISTPPTKTH
jgi:hypothetical protein